MSQKVNYSWKLNPTYIKLNTSEFCFLCLKTAKIKTETTDELDGFSNKNESKESSENPPISLLCLRRYLKINVSEIIGNSTREPESFLNDEVEVNLCKVCERTVCKFSVLFQQLEKIEMEMDYYLEEIKFSIQQGIENPDLVEAYSKGMTSKADTLSQLAWIDKLRKEISQKCLKVRAALHPIVEVNKIAIGDNAIPPIVKEEVFSDIKEEGNSKELVPPASPSTSPSDSSSISNETENGISSAQPASMEFKVDKNTKRVHCSSCDQSFKTKQFARSHFKVIHLKEKWKCGHCSIEIRAWPVAIKNHKNKCHEILEKRSKDAKAREHFKFPCAICNKRFHNQTRLNEHKRLVHETYRPFLCTFCGRRFKRASELKMHSKSVHQGVKWKCKYCMEEFCKPWHRTKHEKTCLKKNDIKVKTEVAANLKFSRDLTGRAQCPSCDKTFSAPCHARRHYIEIHLTERLKCDLCLATFPKYYLNKHRKICSDNILRKGKFLFSCPTCKKKVPTQKSLVQHQRLHFSNSVFPCDLCEKRYKSQQGLNYHKDSVHFNKTFSCEFCKKQFKPGWISEHIKRCKQRNLEVKLELNTQKPEDIVSTTQLNQE